MGKRVGAWAVGGGGAVRPITFGIFVDHVIIFSSRFKPFATSKVALFVTKNYKS